MRKWIWVVALIFLLAVPANAFSGISSAQNQTVVYSDGSCEVTLTVILQLDSVPSSLNFPIPGDAQQISVNGASVSAPAKDGLRQIDLSGYVAAPGTYTLILRYQLPAAVITQDEKQYLQLDLLCGFDYPVDSLGFSVTLPGAVETRPTFTSMYYEDTIETMMTVSQKDNLITGSMQQRLQDHETLTMTLEVPEQMFPAAQEDGWSLSTAELLMVITSALCLLYWALTMAAPPIKALRRTTPPEGVTAGAVSANLTGQGLDLTLTVLSWAQMGYLLIQPDDNGRVLLHKRMEMGNERSELENRIFRQLFGNRRVVDGTGYHYAQLCNKTAHYTPNLRNNYRSGTGNVRILRILSALLGVFGGIILAKSWATDPAWQAVLAVFLAIIGALCAWMMHWIGLTMYSRHKIRRAIGFFSALFWLLLCLLAKNSILATVFIPIQLLVGLAAAFTGKRTPSGHQIAREILGFRNYLRKIKGTELKKALISNPNYYYDLAPYALALGVARAFARNMRKERLSQCPWLTTGMDGHLTAGEWQQLLVDTVAALDVMRQRLPLDRLLGK